jgi:hypothetical protein
MLTRSAAWLLGAAALALTSMSCTTTYDAYGRPVQSVDPGVAVAGAAAAGVVGYAAGRDSGRNVRHNYYSPPRYYRPSRTYYSPGRTYYRY